MKSSQRSSRILSNEYKIWLKKNPLTSWMSKNHISQMKVAAKLGVSTYAVYLWQHGTSVPRPEMLNKIKALTDIDDIIIQWAKWKNEYELKAGGDTL